MYHHPNLVDLPSADGTLPRRFEANAALTYQMLAVGLVMLAGGVVAYWYWQQGELQGEVAMLAFLLPAGGVVMTGLQIRNLLAPLSVVVTPEGLAVGDEECRWDQVAAVREQLHPGELNGLTVWVRRADERTFYLPASRLSDLPRLLATVHQHTLSRLAAEARAAVDCGEAVSFGPVELDASGLRTRDRLLAWEDLARVTPDEAGDLGFWASGRGSAWLDVATGKVDNVRVLLQLVEEYAPVPHPNTSQGW
jgi:hypothetical protein